MPARTMDNPGAPGTRTAEVPYFLSSQFPIFRGELEVAGPVASRVSRRQPEMGRPYPSDGGRPCRTTDYPLEPRKDLDEYQDKILIPSGSPEVYFHLFWPTCSSTRANKPFTVPQIHG